MEKYILRFDEIKKEDIASAGGKGANLGEMTSAGIPVPPGGVLSSEAYARYIRENGIDVSAVASGSGAADIRAAIMSGEFPEEVRSQTLSFYRSLGDGARVAVRSSATAEDLEDASFAGQQETYLNVVGEGGLLESIKKCYASLWGDRAVSYRAKQGYDKSAPMLAVVIQVMVESESAGVCFTRDPSGSSDGVVINASYGLGESVVSGTVSPDEYICSRDGRTVSAVIGSKQTEIVYGGSGTVTRPVDGARRAARVLDDGQLGRLTACALDIEKHYGHPMDVEWAISGGELYILQARSITAAGGKDSFTDADFAGLPKPRPVKGRMRENMLFNLEKIPRPYYPLDHDFGDAVGRQKEKLISELGVKMNEMCPIDGDGISLFDFGGMRIGHGICRIPAFLRGMKDDGENIRVSSEKLAECRERLEKERALAPETPAAFGESLERMLALICDTAYARFRYAIFPQVVENISLGKALKRIDKELTPFDLLEGLGYVTADINREMSELAVYIKSSDEMSEAAMSESYETLCEHFPELGGRFARFLEKYGSRSDYNCYCFAAKSWNDDPERFLGTLRTMLRSGADVPTLEEGREKLGALLTKLKKNRSARSYAALERKINAVRHYHVIREATQYLWESEFAYCRELLAKCAESLGTGTDEMIYLFSDELFDACRKGIIDEKTAELIRRRRDKRPLAEAYWDRCVEAALSVSGDGISGVGGSAGRASGKVCVVSGPEEFGKLQRGEILVCPHTDPEWTPLFTLAAGVVADTGGTLSHAAIVAREYGIPAVLAAGSATKKLRDGDSVLVDGTAGTVTVLAAAGGRNYEETVK